jgi:hypothetical protein
MGFLFLQWNGASIKKENHRRHEEQGRREGRV